MKLIGIAGGSGSGKSTVAIALCRKYPDKIALVHLDDYFKPRETVPVLDGFPNWDHPDALRIDDVLSDLKQLKSGRPITVRTKSELYNPNYEPELRNKIEQVIEPCPVIILEGYLALYDERIRNLMVLKYFLDMPIEESLKRRSGNKTDFGDGYFEKVIKPMYPRFTLPTKQFADVVLPVSNMTSEQVRATVEARLF